MVVAATAVSNVIANIDNNNNNNNNNDNNNNNMNVNMNMVQSMNKRSYETRGEDTSLRARVMSSVATWLDNKVAESPGCVERFVCESFRTGELLEGPSYFLMAVSK